MTSMTQTLLLKDSGNFSVLWALNNMIALTAWIYLCFKENFIFFQIRFLEWNTSNTLLKMFHSDSLTAIIISRYLQLCFVCVFVVFILVPSSPPVSCNL